MLTTKKTTNNASNSIAWEPRLFLKPGWKYSHGANVRSIYDCTLVLRPASLQRGGYPGDLPLDLRHSVQHHRRLLATTVGSEERRTLDYCAWQYDAAGNEKTSATPQSKSRSLATAPGTLSLALLPTDRRNRPRRSGQVLHLT